MDTPRLKKFAQYARRSLIDQVQSKLKLVLSADSAARREHPQAVKELAEKQKQLDDEHLVEQVAYTWFNRFCALRFMDVNQYNRIMVISPISGQFQPEILAEAKAGHLDDSIFNEKTSEQIRGLLGGSIPSRDGQAEAYRLMIVTVCNDYYRLMPYLFERIEDYTELLMPDDLLSGNSILAYTREAMTPENCESVESIGWLYQFYISEKKDQVFADLKKNQKITPENIPAATQLFTPHWIVKYLVENSLGRLWMLNNPNSKVIDQMEYYIKPVGEEDDFLKVSSPEELKLCDPAVGSGHMLTYAYDLLYAIYLDANYDPVDIPELILTKNLYGIEIDERAAELAAFALSMKAIKGNPLDDSNNRRRFFRKPIKPNICRLEKVKIDEDALDEYMNFIGRDLFTQNLRITLTEFEEADNFGSLIQPTLKNVADILAIIEEKNEHTDMFLADTHKSVLKILKQVEYLSPIYHVIIANPPYLGGKGMNHRMAVWLKGSYVDSKSDLFAAFIERGLNLVYPNGYSAMVTMQSWMFLSSYEKLRRKLMEISSIESMAHMGNMVMGIAFGTSATVWKKGGKKDSEGAFCYVELNDIEAENKPKKFPPMNKRNIKAISAPNDDGFYRISSSGFNKIPGSPIAYWVEKEMLDIFNSTNPFEYLAPTRKGMVTARNEHYVRDWHEISLEKTGFDQYHSRNLAQESGKKWFSYLKGGGYRKWFGNKYVLVNWEDDGCELQNTKHPKEDRIWATNFNLEYILKPNVNWGAISTSGFSARVSYGGEILDAGGSGCYPTEISLEAILGFLNSKVVIEVLGALNPTLNFQAGNISYLPLEPKIDTQSLREKVKRLVEIYKFDWNNKEGSWAFDKHIFYGRTPSYDSLKTVYGDIVTEFEKYVAEAKNLEQQVNKELIEHYNLSRTITEEIELEDVTLFINPAYQYRRIYSGQELSIKRKFELVSEFISYSVGCMFGRYSLDKKGLILANQGDTIENYLSKVPSPQFIPDEDNVIPIIDFGGDWFEDDIAERFKAFLKVAFGEEHFAGNLAFIEDAIGKDIKKYFVKGFYTDHVKRYKKRPIYWMFSSPKGSFNVLIYMHRYQPDTASIVLNDYLREFRTKLEARKQSYEQVEISVSASQKDKTQAIKAISKINKVLEEINDYEHDVLYPLAGEKIEIDLDDGVKHNYPLFGKALKKVTGLSK